MGGIQTIDVRLEPAHAGWRLDRALAAAVPTLSRERLKTLIRSGAVEAGGKPVRDPSAKVRGEEALRVAIPEPEPAHNEAQDIPLTIVFEADSKFPLVSRSVAPVASVLLETVKLAVEYRYRCTSKVPVVPRPNVTSPRRTIRLPTVVSTLTGT